MAVGADAEQQQVDAPGSRNLRLIARGLGGDVAGHAIGDPRPTGFHIHMPKQMLLHIGMEASRRLRGDADIFIEVETGHRPE